MRYCPICGNILLIEEGGEEAWKNVDKTMARCPYCSNDQAYFQLRQIRSADEPSTIFYKCCRCMKQWND
eukprot:gene20508-26602_t